MSADDILGLRSAILGDGPMLCPEHDEDVPMMAVPCFVEGCELPHWLCSACEPGAEQ